MVVKNQHYVPQYYLRNFTNEQSLICSFDKFKQKSFPSNVKNIASETYFYDFLQDSEGGKRVQKMEKFFSELEGKASRFTLHIQKKVEGIFNLRNLGKAYSIKVLTSDQKLDLSCLIAIQALRTRDFRNFLIEMFQKSQFIANDITEVYTIESLKKFEEEYSVKLNEPLVEHIKSIGADIGLSILNVLKTDGIPVVQAQFIFDHYKELSETLLNHIWMIGINDTSQPLYTSDHPVVKHRHKDFSGYSSEGIEIVYPLDKSILIIILEKNHFQKCISLDRNLYPLTFNDIRYYNGLQVSQSNRMVFCSEDKFDLAREICQKYPAVCYEEKNRIQFKTDHPLSE